MIVGGETQAELEAMVRARQAKINRAERDLDAVIVGLGYLARSGGTAQEQLLRRVKDIQKGLRS